MTDSRSTRNSGVSAATVCIAVSTESVLQAFEQFIAGGDAVDDGDRTDRQACLLIGVLSFEEGRIQCLHLRHAQSPPSIRLPYQYPVRRPGAEGPKR